MPFPLITRRQSGTGRFTRLQNRWPLGDWRLSRQ